MQGWSLKFILEAFSGPISDPLRSYLQNVKIVSCLHSCLQLEIELVII